MIKHRYVWPFGGALVVISVMWTSSGGREPERFVLQDAREHGVKGPAVSEAASMEESLDAVESVAATLRRVEELSEEREAAGAVGLRDWDLDKNWARIPVTRITLSRMITDGMMHEFRSSSMLRNVFLNPRDAYIAPAVRLELTAVLEGIAPHLQRFRELQQAANSSEFRFAIESGDAKRLEVPVRRQVVTKADGRYHRATVTIRDVQEQGVDMVVEKGGVLFGMSRADMPLSSELLQQERFLRLEIAAALLGWFARVGVLMESEHDALLESVSRK